ncbi:hypothetical protein ACFE04_014169 [Oxalis oulophora]
MSTLTSNNNNNNKKMIVLESYDKETFEVDKSVIQQSQMIKNMIEDCCTNECIPVPNVSSNILAKVIEYCNKHAADHYASKGQDSDTRNDAELKTWDADFVKVDKSTLYDLIMAANYLDIQRLLDLSCETVAEMIEPEEIRKEFNITNDFTHT